MRDATLERLPVAAPPRAPIVHAPQRRLRILFASYRAHPHVGGQGVYARELTRALVELGHHVDVAAGPPYPDLDPRVRLIRLPSLDLFTEANALAAFRPRMLGDWPDLAEWTLHNTGAFGEPYAFGARLARWLAARAGDYDVVHDNQGLFRHLLTIQARGLPVAATVHHPITVDLRLALEAAPTRIDRWLLRRWHGFVRTQTRVARALPALLTVSQASRRAIAQDFGVAPGAILVAHNGVDHDVFRPRPEIVREPGHVVAAASSDVPLKGLKTLIEAFAIAANKLPTARLTVIGKLRDGPAADALKLSGLGERVAFRSGLERDEIARLYASAAVVAAPSLFEGFGFPAAEAMATGAAVVASDGGALPEVVGDAGLVTPAGDAPALAAAIVDLLNDEARRDALGLRALQRARNAFSWRAHAEAAVQLYAAAGVDAHRRA